MLQIFQIFLTEGYTKLTVFPCCFTIGLNHINNILNLYIDGNYTLFNCTAPIRIEGMFADFLYAANTFKRFTDMDLFERDVLNIKLKKLAECSEIDLEVEGMVYLYVFHISAII